MSSSNMAKRTALGTLALAVCLGGGALALAAAAGEPPTPHEPTVVSSPAPGETP